MILAEVLGCWNVAARGQSRVFFNTIDPEPTLATRRGRPQEKCSNSDLHVGRRRGDLEAEIVAIMVQAVSAKVVAFVSKVLPGTPISSVS
jgi:hypothetical protein